MNYSLLRERIRKLNLSHYELARLAGISEFQLSRKLNGKTGFTQKEILRICSILEIKAEEIGSFFFQKKK